MILRPGTSPGQCWAFRGTSGTVVIRLSSPVAVTAVTLRGLTMGIRLGRPAKTAGPGDWEETGAKTVVG